MFYGINDNNNPTPGVNTESLKPNAESQMLNNENIIVVKDLVKKFGHFVANDRLTFEVRKGEISFKAERSSGVSFYKGTIEGDLIKGTIETGTEEAKRTLEWEARRVGDAKEADPES